MPFSIAARNTMLDALAVSHASLHSADPGDTGANEISGGSPAYARKAVTVGAASNGQRALSASATFDVPAGATVAYVGYWTALTGGTFLGSDDVTAEVYAGQGTYTLQSGSTLSLT